MRSGDFKVSYKEDIAVLQTAIRNNLYSIFYHCPHWRCAGR